MHLPEKQSKHLNKIAKRLAGLAEQILEGVEPDGEPVLFDNVVDLLESQPATRLFLVKSGQLRCERDRKLVHSIDPGDLIGLARSLKLPEGPYLSDTPVELVPYQRSAIIKHVNTSEELLKHWTFYLVCLANFFHEALAQEIRGQYQPATGFLNFEPGDTIINQGEEAECVYTMLEGSADVLHNDVKVGDVKAEEIFGAMAVFTQQPRSASVVATSSCSVLAVRKDQFLDLVVHQPQLCLSLIEEMADKINQLNSQVLSLQ